MPRVSGRSTVAKPAAAPLKVTATTVAKLKRATAEALKSSTVKWSRKQPPGVRFVRVPLIKGRTDQYSFTALVPVGGKNDANKPKVFVLERSGGLAGLREYSTPLAMNGKPAKPLFDKLLTNQKKADVGAIATERYPSDQEDLGGGGGRGVTERYPSDDDVIGGGGGGVGVTERYPSDNESIGGTGGGGGGGSGFTERYPSDSD